MRNLFTKMGGVESAARKMGKNILSLLLITSAAFASCTNDEVASQEERTAPLSLNVGLKMLEHQSRAMITGTTLPDNSRIGVFLKDNQGNDYDGQDYNNILYTVSDSKVTTEGQVWLSGTEGRVYAYYPYSETVTDITQIPVELESQTDYMYATCTSGIVTYSAPAASLTMNHILAGIKVNVKKTNEQTKATISDVSIISMGAAKTADMNAMNGTLSNFTGQGEAFTQPKEMTLTTTSQELGTFMVVPTGVSGKLRIDLTLNGSKYTVSSSALTLAKGVIHVVDLVFNNVDEMEIANVSVADYTSKDVMSANLYPRTPSNGEVYAVTADGSLISGELGDETCIAAALIVGDHKFWIEKNESDNAAYAGAEYLYWLYSEASVADIPDYFVTGGGGTDDNGYLLTAKWTYKDSPALSYDYKTWTSGALSDFNGADNTAALVAASSNAKDMGIVLKNFNAATDGQNCNKNDWYIPACGQLALMYMNLTEINQTLTAIGGMGINLSDYFSSSESHETYRRYGWYVSFFTSNLFSGHVGLKGKKTSSRVRFIRDI